MAARTLTISGYEWRLKKFFRILHEEGMHHGIKRAAFKDIWDLDKIGYGRLCKALERLYKKKILIKPVIDGKEVKGAYKWNPC